MNSYEQELTKRLKRGDREAQRELYDRFSAPLMAISMRYMGSRDDAEDLLHDAFIKIFGSIGKFKYRGEGSLRAWISRIVVNAALEQLRGSKRHLTVSLQSSDAAEVDMAAAADVAAVPQAVLQKFIAELPDGYRTVFNLFCIEEYSHREIARMLGINEKSSSSQLLRAKRMLAARIRSYIDTNE